MSKQPAARGRSAKERALIQLDIARWRLALIWFPTGGVIFLILIAQSMGGVYGTELEKVYGWALPNFLPTIALMLSVFAADALKPYSEDVVWVRRNFLNLAVALSVFYLLVLLLAVLVQPMMQWLRGPDSSSPAARIELLQTSNLWLGPLQGLVVIALGVLFFLKEEDRSPRAGTAEPKA